MTISWTEFSLFFLPEYSKHETGAMNKKLVLLARKKKYAPLRQMITKKGFSFSTDNEADSDSSHRKGHSLDRDPGRIIFSARVYLTVFLNGELPINQSGYQRADIRFDGRIKLIYISFLPFFLFFFLRLFDFFILFPFSVGDH